MLCFGDGNLGGAHSASPMTGERERKRFLQEKAFDQGLEKSAGVFQEWGTGVGMSPEACKDLMSDSGFPKTGLKKKKINATSGSVG